MKEKGKHRTILGGAPLVLAAFSFVILCMTLYAETGHDKKPIPEPVKLKKSEQAIMVIAPWFPMSMLSDSDTAQFTIWPGMGNIASAKKIEIHENVDQVDQGIKKGPAGKTILLPDEFILYQDRS